MALGFPATVLYHSIFDDGKIRETNLADGRRRVHVRAVPVQEQLPCAPPRRVQSPYPLLDIIYFLLAVIVILASRAPLFVALPLFFLSQLLPSS